MINAYSTPATYYFRVTNFKKAQANVKKIYDAGNMDTPEYAEAIRALAKAFKRLPR